MAESGSAGIGTTAVCYSSPLLSGEPELQHNSRYSISSAVNTETLRRSWYTKVLCHGLFNFVINLENDEGCDSSLNVPQGQFCGWVTEKPWKRAARKWNHSSVCLQRENCFRLATSLKLVDSEISVGRHSGINTVFLVFTVIGLRFLVMGKSVLPLTVCLQQWGNSKVHYAF